MADTLGMTAQLTSNALKFGWYYAINQLVDRAATREGSKVAYRPERPVPSRNELFAELRDMFQADAAAVRDGLYPPMDVDPAGWFAALPRLRRMFADIPNAARRRQSRDTSSVQQAADTAGLPEYFTQDFHYQTGGYLSDDSAKIYDVQVETLFYGAANAMRRSALRPIANELRGRDQRKLRLLDIACGTGRLLRQVRLAFPALQLTGLDLSSAYLAEAQAHMGDLRPAAFVEANAETQPFEDASFDIVTSVFLFHELPPEVRRTVTAEIARVLKPGGAFVFVDSLQIGDRPGWDGLLEAFPVRFHEPYYRHYVIDDLDDAFSQAGLEAEASALPFLSKMMVRRKNLD